MWRRRRRRLNELRQQFNDEEEAVSLVVISNIADEDEQVHRGSVIGRRVIPRDRYIGYIRLMNDYFVDNPVYGENMFRRRFELFLPMPIWFQNVCQILL